MRCAICEFRMCVSKVLTATINVLKSKNNVAKVSSVSVKNGMHFLDGVVPNSMQLFN